MFYNISKIQLLLIQSSLVSTNFSDATLPKNIAAFLYFSAPSWKTSRLSPQLPVRAHVYGKTAMPNGQKRPFDHMYEFVDFITNPTSHVTAYQVLLFSAKSNDFDGSACYYSV